MTYMNSSVTNARIDLRFKQVPAARRARFLRLANLDWVEFEEQINYPNAEINPDVQASLTTSE